MFWLRSGRSTLAVAAIVVSTLCSNPHDARAQSAAANATRRDLIDQATQARTAGNHAQAVDLLVRAGEIRMTVSLRMALAEEQAAMGRLTSALDNAETCTREVRTQEGVTDRDTVAARCASLVQALRGRVAHVVIQVPADAPGIDVRVSHDVVPASLYNVPYVVNPGPVVVDVTATNRTAFHRELQFHEGESQTVEVTLPLAPGATATTGTTASGSPETGTESTSSPGPHTATTTTTASSEAPVTTQTTRPTASYAVMVVGVLGLGFGGVAWGLRASAFSGCTWGSTGPGVCATQAEQQSAMGTGRTFNLIAPIATIAGGVVLVGGFAWWLLGAHTTRSTSARSNVTPWFAAGGDGAMAGVLGRF